MNTSVCVLSNNGERLMPTFRLSKVRRLLKDGKAKIVKHHPFTIQLLYDSKTNTQPIEICEDVGYNYIGISAKSKSREYVSTQYDTLQDEKEHHDDCRKMRRSRRNRLRYRKPRFDNRKPTNADELVVDYLANPTGWAERTMERIKKASLEYSGLQFWITLAMTEELTEEYVKKYSNPDTPEGKFKSLTDSIKNYKNVHLGLDVNGEIDSVKYPVDGIFNMDAMYDGYLDTWNITPRSEEERIEEFLEENDALLKNQDKIPFKYISDIHYGKKTVWKNPDFEN